MNPALHSLLGLLILIQLYAEGSKGGRGKEGPDSVSRTNFQKINASRVF